MPNPVDAGRELPDTACPNCSAGEQFNHPELGPMPGYIAGRCGHRVAGTEWLAGFRTCERCPDPGCVNCIHLKAA